MCYCCFQVIDVLSKLAGLWVNADKEIMYSQASQITFICPMVFNTFPLDTQVTLTLQITYICIKVLNTFLLDSFVGRSSTVKTVRILTIVNKTDKKHKNSGFLIYKSSILPFDGLFVNGIVELFLVELLNYYSLLS